MLKNLFMDRVVNQPQAVNFARYGLKEYLLVAHPDTTTNALLMKEKQYFSDHFGEKTAIKTRPHITIMNFLAKEMMEATFLRYMYKILHEQPSFYVHLNNFSGFPPHTIYARVQDKTPFRQIIQQLKAIDTFLTTGNVSPQYKTNAHLTICRQIPENIYDKAMLEYSQRVFYSSFKVDELVLLKRDHQFDACQQATIFKLQPLNETVTTGTLFN